MPGTNDDRPVAPKRPNTVPDRPLDAALERVMLDAQLVAHAQKHDRLAFREREQRAELRAVIDEVGAVFVRDGTGLLAMLGVTLTVKAGELRFAKSDDVLVVRAGVDGVIEVGDRGVQPDEPFFTDALYRRIQGRVVSWAMAVVGQTKSLWGEKDRTVSR